MLGSKTMKFDIESESEAVQAFVLATIEEFHHKHGRASVIRFDVQAIYGQIHAYPSTHHTPETIFDDVGITVNFIYDSDSWMNYFDADDTLKYKNLSCTADGAAGDFNDFISLMVYDAVIISLKKVSAEQMPKSVVVEAALECAGTFYKVIIPNERQYEDEPA